MCAVDDSSVDLFIIFIDSPSTYDEEFVFSSVQRLLALKNEMIVKVKVLTFKVEDMFLLEYIMRKLMS